ncbi:MAG: MFS transporter, partial [Acholeplasmataceae bacterium]|nr:MFS transporter [Acholeplasmataceae bacterium]
GMIVAMFADETLGFQVMSLSFGTLFAISVLVTGLFAREEIQTPAVTSKLSFKSLAKPLGLRPFRQYLFMFMMLQMTMAIMSGLFFFYVDFYVSKTQTASGESTMVGLIGAALMFSMQIVALPIYLKIIQKKGKTFAYRTGATIWILTALFILIIPQDVTPVVIYVLAAFMGLGISGAGLVPHTMYGDVVDAGQLKFKDRLDGQMSGFTNFINKIAQALGISFVMFLIGLAGFTAKDPGGPDILSQPDSAMLMVRLIMVFAPLVFMSIGMMISLRYKIDAKKQKEITDAIKNNSEDQEKILASL